MSAAAGQCGQDSDELNFDFGRYFVSWALNSGYEKVSGQRTEAATSNPSTISPRSPDAHGMLTVHLVDFGRLRQPGWGRKLRRKALLA